jgi:hypothetical protein
VKDKRRYRQLRVAKGGPYLLSGLLYCGHCGRKLYHRSRPGSENGIYLCVHPGGKWCPGGSIDCAFADRFVRDRFLDRCQFSLGSSEPTTFSASQRGWERASLPDRRRLLFLAMRRVVLVPWPGGDAPRRVPGARRELRIEWARGTGQNFSLVLQADLSPPSPIRAQVSEGRSDMMRELEGRRRDERRQELSERFSTYYSEWARFRRERLETRT